MSITTYNVPPYYDDFDPAKNYLRVLFRPGYAVQARELTQLQTAIQAQIERFGNHIFKNGSQVIGGQAALDTSYAFIKLESTFTYSSTTYWPEGNTGLSLAAYYEDAVGDTLKVVTDTLGTGITATILEFLPSTTEDYLTAYVRYTRADGENHLFAAEDVLVSTTNPGYKFKVVESSENPFGYGSRVSVNEGVYYVNGNFVYTPAAAIIISKYSPYPSARVVYKISENIVTSVDDPTLVDNALGTPNDSAPGAHRYQIALDLAVEPIDLTERVEANIIQILAVKGGAITARARSEYSELANTLATRTYEESGNYTVRPFRLNIREYYNSGSNNGLYTAAQIQALVDSGFTESQAIEYGSARLAVGLEPAVAYVNGYRIETLDTTYVTVEKARDEAVTNSAVLSCPLGGYVYIDTLVGAPDISTYSTITLKNGSSATIGTARARAIEYVSGTIGTSAAAYKLYLFDVSITSGSFADVRTLTDTTVTGYDFSATVNDIDASITDSILYDTANSSLIFKLPTTATNTAADFIYSVRRKFNSVHASGTNVTLTGASGEIFTSSTAADYVCARDTTGAIIAATYVSGAGTSSVVLNMGVGTNEYFTIVAPTTRTNFSQKSKTLQEDHITTISSPNTTLGGYDSLGVTDVLRIKGIYMSADFNTAANVSTDPDIQSRYELDNGQRENFYDLGRIRLKPSSSAPTGQIKVVLDYFTHGTGDYFSVNSYNSSLYDLIPSFNSIKGKIELRDAIDFRPTKNSAGTGFTSTGADVTNTILPGSLLFTDLQYYLPRIDKIYVNKTGEFGVQYGISSTKPEAPADPADSMTLYTLSLNAYTFSTTDLSAKMMDNRRYTMRDIGRLENRISRVEYYTSLSLLEKETAARQIMDGTNPRYKNGFVVDPFVNHGIGAINHSDYHCSIDAENGVLRPEFYPDNVALAVNMLDPNTSGVTKTGPLITLNYTEVPAISQPYASYGEYVNPHAVYGWRGNVKLSPPGDDWKETLVKPAIVANADTSQVTVNNTTAATAAGSTWNNWNSNWFGVTYPIVLAVNDANGIMQPVNSTNSAIKAQTSGQTTSNGVNRLNSGAYNTVTTQTTVDKIIDTAVIPYIRSRKVYFSVTGMKPNTKLYAFFDGANIANYISTNDVYVEYSTNPDNTNYLDVTSHPSTPTEIITDGVGAVQGSFIIPNNSAMKFLTGSRVFRLIDNVTNDVNSAYTFCDITYTANGILETHQATIYTTVTPAVVNPVKPVNSSVVAYNPPYVTLSIDGATPTYTGTGVVKLKGTAWTSGVGVTGAPYTAPISSLVVKGRSGNPSASSGSWVTVPAYFTRVLPTYGSFEFTVQPSDTSLAGQYQWYATITVNGGAGPVEYTSSTVTVSLANA